MSKMKRPLYEDSVYEDTVAVPGRKVWREDAALPLREGQIVAGRYRVGRLLGAGGMGLIFEGEHLELGSRVAIKTIRPQFASDDHVLRRFVNEACSVAALDNPHIARVFDAGQLDSGAAFLVMERLSGKDLLTELRESGPLRVELALEYVRQACDGLAEAHAHGLIHRDIKPEHLFIVPNASGEPLVKILDFGISKRIDAEPAARVTHPGDSIGSPCYMSPEQVQNPAEVDGRTDVWSIGVVLYEILTGKRPFDGDSMGQIQWNVIAEPPAPMSSLRAGIPVELERIVDRCLAKNKEERYASVSELGRALRAISQPLPPHRVGDVEPSGDTLDVAVAPRRGAPRLAKLLFAAIFLGACAVLALWALGGHGAVTALRHGLNPESDHDGSHAVHAAVWQPVDPTPVKLSTVRAPKPELRAHSAPEPVSAATTAENQSDPAPAVPPPAVPRRSMNKEQIEERYRRWLESENLVPVDELTLDDLADSASDP